MQPKSLLKDPMKFSLTRLMSGSLASVLALIILSQFTACTEEETPSSEKQILSFTLQGLSPAVDGSIDDTKHTILLDVPAGTDLTALVPTITFSPKATLFPEAETPVNFTTPVAFRVTAEDKTKQEYVVTVVSGDKKISSFKLDASVSATPGVINESNHSIVLKVPYNTDVTSLTPTISFTGKNISPASNVTQNFTSPIAYTVTASNGSTQVYSVSAEVQPVNPAAIAWSAPLFSFGFIRSLVTSGKDLLVGHSGGIDRSTDNGKTWVRITPSTIFFIFTITIDGNKIYAGGDGKVFYSGDNGATWSTLVDLGSGQAIRSILVKGNSILATTLSKGVFITNDGGVNWSPLNNGITNLNLFIIFNTGTNLITSSSDASFISTDAGANWTPLALPAGRGFLMIDNNLFGVSEGKPYISTNNGLTWTLINAGITGTVNGFCRDKNNIFATSSTGLFLSTNMGASWTPLGSGWPDTSGVAGIVVNGPSIFACTYQSVYKSGL